MSNEMLERIGELVSPFGLELKVAKGVQRFYMLSRGDGFCYCTALPEHRLLSWAERIAERERLRSKYGR